MQIPFRPARSAAAFITAALGASLAAASLGAQTAQSRATPLLIVPDRVFDGTGAAARTGVAVLVDSGRVIAVGARAALTLPAGTQAIEMPGTTLLPGLIDLHSHVLLHPYNEVAWDEQVLREACKACIHSRGP